MALPFRKLVSIGFIAALFGASLQAQPVDVTQPGDPIFTNTNLEFSEFRADKAIDNSPTKHLNWNTTDACFTLIP